jgi:hypothetical protein
MTAVAEHMNQRTRRQQQKRQIRQAHCEVGAVLCEQVERGNREQQPESDAQLPRTLGARAIRIDASTWHGWIGFHRRISFVQSLEGRINVAPDCHWLQVGSANNTPTDTARQRGVGGFR